MFLLSVIILCKIFFLALAPPLLACEEDDVPCLDGRHCLETSAVCDGEVDCQDESDEHEYCKILYIFITHPSQLLHRK